MKLKNLFQYGFVATCLLGNVMAMDDRKSDDALLIVGCRPWDDNVKGVSGLETAHFVDFMALGVPTPMPSNFHHVDLNDTGANSAGKFTGFAASHFEEFKTIIIDWMTYHHIRRDGAWTDFAALLRSGGKLIVPVTKSNNSGSISKQTAQEIVDGKLTDLFGAVEILSYGTMPTDTCFDLLRRDGMGITRCALSFTPAIIVATKGLAVSKELFNSSVVGVEVSEKIEAKLSIEPETKAEKMTTFKAPTVDEIKQHLSASDDSNPLLKIGGLILKPMVYDQDSIRSIVSRVLRLTAYHATYLIEKEGKLNRVIFGYDSDRGGIELSVDFDSMGIDPGTVKHADKLGYQVTAPGYMTSYNSDLQFKIG